MDWFMQLPTEVQIPIVGLVGTVLTIAGVMVNARFARPSPNKEQEYKRPPMEVRLSDHDRDLLENFREAIRDHGEEIGRHREELIRHPPATGRRGG